MTPKSFTFERIVTDSLTDFLNDFGIFLIFQIGGELFGVTQALGMNSHL